jgi:hypothetical protein
VNQLRYEHRDGVFSAAGVLVAAVLVLLLAVPGRAEPAWTHTGDCKACHTVSPSASLLSVVNSDGEADPDGSGPLPSLKVFRADRGQVGKTLAVQIAGLDPGDGYAVEVLGLTKPGVLASAQLLYSADCNWTDWDWGQDHFYSNVTRYGIWGGGPTILTYSIGIDANAAYDYYDLLFAVVGIKAATGQRYYQEEHVYLSVPPANWTPMVAITAPVNNATFSTPTDVVISAWAEDPDGTIAKVEFFAGATLVGQATEPPYVTTWSSVPAGSYALSARATDNVGATNVSPTVNIVVIAPPPVPGDYDHDGDVDQSDYGHLQYCFSNVTTPPGCTDASLDANAVVDNVDVMIFQRCLSGPGVQGDWQCEN